MSGIELLKNDAAFMAREPQLAFRSLRPACGEQLLAVDDIQPLQSAVSGPHLAALSRAHVPLPPVTVLTIPNAPRPLLIEGHHRTYLSHHLGMTVVHAQLIRGEEEYREAVVEGAVRGARVEGYHQLYNEVVTNGLLHISHVQVQSYLVETIETGLTWPGMTDFDYADLDAYMEG